MTVAISMGGTEVLMEAQADKRKKMHTSHIGLALLKPTSKYSII